MLKLPAAFDPYALDGEFEASSARIAPANVEESAFLQTLSELCPNGCQDWCWCAAATPEVGVPYLLLERPGADHG